MYLPMAQVGRFVEALAALPRAPAEHISIFLANTHHPQLDALVEGLKDAGLPFFGGVFPALIDSGTVRHEATIVRTVLRRSPVVAAIGEQQVDWPTPLPAGNTFAAEKPRHL